MRDELAKVLYCHSARNGWEQQQESVSWKKIRSKSGGHLYHHIHELDCIQFLMGPATTATMVGGNVAHSGEHFGDEDDMLFITLEFGNNTYAVVEYGSAFRWSEHYLLIQGTKGAIRLDMKDTGVTLRTPEGDEHFLLHRIKEEDDDRTLTYNIKNGNGWCRSVWQARKEAAALAAWDHGDGNGLSERPYARCACYR